MDRPQAMNAPVPSRGRIGIRRGGGWKAATIDRHDGKDGRCAGDVAAGDGGAVQQYRELAQEVVVSTKARDCYVF